MLTLSLFVVEASSWEGHWSAGGKGCVDGEVVVCPG